MCVFLEAFGDAYTQCELCAQLFTLVIHNYIFNNYGFKRQSHLKTSNVILKLQLTIALSLFYALYIP